MRKKFAKLRLLIFSIGIIFIWYMAGSILKKPTYADWNTSGMKNVNTKKDHYDVLFLGTSMAVTNISAEELYIKYGIAGMSIGQPLQMEFLSYYSLEQALKKQSPQAVIFDTQALFYTEEIQKEHIEQDEAFYVHTTLDTLKNDRIKYQAVEEVKELHPDTTYWEYFSNMYYSHSNWENLNIDNFVSQRNKDIVMGSRSLFGVLENTTNDDVQAFDDNIKESADIPEINIEYLRKMKELCEKNNVELILVRSYGRKYWQMEQYNAIKSLADEMNLKFFDMAEYEDEIGFDWATDSCDGTHHNINGARKWTDFLGEYLANNFKFTDKRGLKNYQEYESEKSRYQDIEAAMEQKISLLRATNFNVYLDTLLNLEKEGTTIFISVNGDGNLTEYSQKFLTALGCKKNSEMKKDDSYYAVIDDGKIIAEKCCKEGDIINGMIGESISFEIASGGYLSQINAEIKIDEESITMGNGINIVVYNKKFKEVLSAAFFDTSLDENPTTSRYNENGMIESEIKTNFWTEKI